MITEKLEELKKAISELIKAQKDSEKASDQRAKLGANCTRSRMTSSNALWATKAEYRDKCISKVQKLYEEIF